MTSIKLLAILVVGVSLIGATAVSTSASSGNQKCLFDACPIPNSEACSEFGTTSETSTFDFSEPRSGGGCCEVTEHTVTCNVDDPLSEKVHTYSAVGNNAWTFVDHDHPCVR